MATDDSADRVGHFSHAIEPKDLKPGDQIYCYRIPGFYTHHGIYIGEDDCEVIHFSIGSSGMKHEPGSSIIPVASRVGAKVHKTMSSNEAISKALGIKVHVHSCSLAEFCDGSDVRLVAYNYGKSLKLGFSYHVIEAMPPSETVKLAKYYRDYPDKWKDYDLKDNNCEVFACFCKTGRLDIAHQLNEIRKILDYPKEPLTTADKAIAAYKLLCLCFDNLVCMFTFNLMCSRK